MEDEQHYEAEHRGLVKEEREPLIKSGCTFGRALNGCIALIYLLVLLTALIVSGSLGVLNSKLANDYPDQSANNRTCILFTHCKEINGKCTHIEYNSSGGCQFIVAGFGIVGFFALVYIFVCIARLVLATDIWYTVIADILANIFIIMWVFIMGVTISIGLAITCSEIHSFSVGSNSVNNCSSLQVPKEPGYKFYRETNVAQSSAWFCFLFLFIATGIFLVRSCIFCRRKASIPAMDNTEILTATDTFKEDEDQPAKPV